MTDKPELLAPAGSYDALKAAISAGADAVYFGAKSFNARYGAKNFDDDELRSAIRLCRVHGVKTNITVNTQFFGRETAEGISLIESLMEMGADAFIVADLGLAGCIHRMYPDAVLHASTQACGQNVYSAEALKDIGFSRMVAPRELSYGDLKILTEKSPIETEIFVHGALCVSFSGQCLMSSVIGGRSGNRGECAQPCRLPYKCRCEYPLSLKDSCLAGHMKEILGLGVASLKIEGRMKSPDYVYGVTSVYRRLIDENRDATDDEIRELSEIFSRSGFTDGYYREQIDRSMLGIRTEQQKTDTKNLEKADIPEKKIDISIKGDFSTETPVITAFAERNGQIYTASVSGSLEESKVENEIPAGRLKDSLGKCGGTVFNPVKIETVPGPGARMPISYLNGLRRQVIENLEKKLAGTDGITRTKYIPEKSEQAFKPENTAYFKYASAITEKALKNFDAVFVPAEEYKHAPENSKVGISIPPVVFDHELEAVDSLLRDAKKSGCTKILVTSLWQAERYGKEFEAYGDFRLNACNTETVAVLRKAGIKNIVASTEIGIPKTGALGSGISAVMYGRLPLMTMQKCAIKEIAGIKSESCSYCDTHRFTALNDRTNARFLVSREFGHRNVIFNSVPVWMCDRKKQYTELGLGSHFIFTDETPEEVDEVIYMAEKSSECKGKFKRI